MSNVIPVPQGSTPTAAQLAAVYAGVRIPVSCVACDDFKVGNMTDQQAMDAAIAACTVPGGPRAILLGARDYLFSTVAVPANVAILGSGLSTNVPVTGNSPVFDVQGENVLISNLRFTGNVSAYAPGTNQIGVRNVAYSRVYMDRVHFRNLGIGYKADTPGPEVYLGPVLTSCVATECSTGFLFSTSEYHTATGCIARGCYDVGFDVASGNIALIGGAATSCNVGVKVRASANDAHGIVSGMQINHNSQAIWVEGIANGHTFADCHVYYGNIYVISSTGVQFIGGEYDLGAYYFQGSTGTTFDSVRFPNASANTINDSYSGAASTEEWKNCRKLDGTPFIGGYVSMTPVNGAQTLTYTQSHAEFLELAAGASAGFTLTSKQGPAANSRQTIRNNTTQTATFGWKTGTTVTVATATSAVIVGDGTNARKMVAGT